MLFRRETLDRIAAGEVTLAFRRWKRPTVKAGGRLTTPVGVLAIEAVEPVEEGAIAEADARRAGHASKAALLETLNSGTEGQVYRVAFRLAGEDPRVALRNADRLDDAERATIAARLERLDRASPRGRWTKATLDLIQRRPGERAAALAETLGLETQAFKRGVRKLKALGLTESLETGYRLSPRGKAVIDGEGGP